MAAAQKIDWERIEPDWRAGVKSVLQIAAEYEAETSKAVSHTAINKHFKKLGIPRDLSAKVQAKANAMVSAAMVSGKVSVETTATDAEIINRCAMDVATVQLTHRKDIDRYRKLCQSMLTELESESANPELFAEIGEILAQPDDKGQDRLNEAYKKAISLPQRIDGVKKLAETLKTLIGLERQAFGMSDSAEGDKPKIPEKTDSPVETARKIAFAVALGLKHAKAAD